MTQVEYECEFQALICKREGMIAENKIREHRGEAMAFNHDDFLNLAVDFVRIGLDRRTAIERLL